MALGRLSLLKSILDISAATYDSELKRHLEAATSYAENYTHRTLVSATQTDERHSGDDRKYLYPDVYPATSLTSVSIWDTGTETFTAETASYFEIITDANDHSQIVYPKLGQESNSTYSSWPSGTNNIKITYVGGYSDTNWDSAAITASFGVPDDLEQCVCLIAAMDWMDSRKGEGRMGKKVQTINEQEIQVNEYRSGYPPNVMHTLNVYRKRTW